MSDPILLDSVEDVYEDVGGLFIKRQQFIPNQFMEDIRKEREDSISTPAGDFHRVARIPTAVIDKWYREGFDYMRAPVREILRKLALEQQEQFITTKKRI
jgi:hypothetical protein